LVELKDMVSRSLNQVAKDLSVTGAAGLRKQELIFKILQTQAEKSGLIFSEGVLESCRTALASCARRSTTSAGPDTSTSRLADSPIRLAYRRYDLRPDPSAQGRRALFRADQSGRDQLRAPEEARNKIFFDNLTPLYPNARLKLETVREKLFRPRDGPAHAYRQGTAWPDRFAAAHRQDDAAASRSPIRSPLTTRKRR